MAEEQAVDLTLPSGMTIRARRPHPLTMATWGALPLRLAGAVAAGRAIEMGDLTDEELRLMVESQRRLLEWCVLQPRISLTPAGTDEIHPMEIPDEDTAFILGWARRSEEVGALEAFRRREGVRGGMPGGEDVGGAAVGDAGDRGSVGGSGSGHGGAEGHDRAGGVRVVAIG